MLQYIPWSESEDIINPILTQVDDFCFRFVCFFPFIRKKWKVSIKIKYNLSIKVKIC